MKTDRLRYEVTLPNRPKREWKTEREQLDYCAIHHYYLTYFLFESERKERYMIEPSGLLLKLFKASVTK